jgi:hypothetical protein
MLKGCDSLAGLVVQERFPLLLLLLLLLLLRPIAL